MHKYVLGRLSYAVLVVFGVSLLVFVLTRMVGNPIDVMLPLEASQEEKIRLAHQLGLDKPVLVQFYDYISGAVRGDFGQSWWQQQPSLPLAVERLPATLELVGTAFLGALLLGIPLGILAAARPGTIVDGVASTVALLGVSLPAFWLGLMLILTFAVRLGWFYTSGIGTIRHLVLPATTLGALALGRITQIVRTAMLDQMHQQYVTTARSKGLTERVVVMRHALKNASIPIATFSGWEVGRMLAGYTVVVEVVFGWPGQGHLIVDTIAAQDFPLLQALVIVVAITVSTINLLVDLSYPLLDPRIKFSK